MSNENTNVIFLDFDGVLFDSLLEAYLLARYAYSDISPMEKIDSLEYNKFRQGRYLVSNSIDYYYIWKIITKSSDTVVKDFYSSFMEMKKKSNLKNAQEFDIKFQNKRKELIENHYEFWNKLDKPYEFLNQIKLLNLNKNICILSTKNESAIIRHLKDYDFEIPEDRIFGKETIKLYKTKTNFIQKYISENKIDKAIFIDDCVDNFVGCENIKNLTYLQAKWGYVAYNVQQNNSNEIIDYLKEFE